MEAHELIESGMLELFVMGITTEEENNMISEMATRHSSVREEISSIENALLSLSYSMAPPLRPALYEQTKNKLGFRSDSQRKGINWSAITGWAAAILFLLGCGYLYSQLDSAENRVSSAETAANKMKADLQLLTDKQAQTEQMLTFIRNENNTIVPLQGQPASPYAKAKIYWNRDTQEVIVDAGGLPIPPEGMEYQVWSMVMEPVMTPSSIGMLKDFSGNKSRMFSMDGASVAEAFGITLEPAGGSPSPSLDQLYAMGRM